MFIDIDIIAAWGGVQKKYNKGELIFSEGDQCRYYYQIIEGAVKMFNINLEGREFTQGIFYEGESFGEPPLFTNVPYPASAEACQNSIIIRLPKEIFLKLLEENSDIQMKLILLLANRAYSKAMTAKIIMNSTPEVRILSFMDYYKSKHKLGARKVLIPITRQQIANHTGLRVETTIRTLSRLKDKGRVEIINHKVYY
jgi:CRP-like cAMP-binding protein